MSIVTGYLHPGYADSLKEFGIPRELPRCKGWLLERQIPGFPYRDAMGCYPLFACQDWTQLHTDLNEAGSELVSLALVTDPFGDYQPIYLHRCFGDVVFPFKEHFVVDLSRPMEEIVGRRHRKNARRALRKVQVDVCEEPTQFICEWSALYDELIEKHNISGISAFSRTGFEKQLSLPGTVVLRATHDDVAVGAQIYFVQGDVVHCHLGAASRTGYELGVVHALDFYSIEYFSGKVHWLNLGGGAGITNDGTDGLSMYKRGWSTETRIAYFCGRIFNRERYAEIVKAKGIAATDYFPAYRKGEFG
jgi:hypothetical protein